MRKLIITTCAVFAAGNLMSQTQSIFRDDYNDNKNQWFLIEETTYAAEIVAGHYNLDLKKEGMYWCVWEPIALNPSKPFIIKNSFVMSNKSKNGHFGISWGIEDLNNNYTFLISKTGKCAVYQRTNGEIKYIVNWKALPMAVNLEQAYTLTLKSDGSNYSFYLDDQKVAETPWFTFPYGNGIGYFVENFVDVKVDWIEVFQDRGALNIVDGSDKFDVKKENLGSNVNTVYTEKKPTISHDGKTLYFTREGDPANTKSKERDDIWVSKSDENKLFGKAENLGAPINNGAHNSVVGVAEDNSWMVVKGLYNAEGEWGGKGFSISQHSGNGWSKPQAIVVKDYYNDNMYEEACISPDGNVLMFAIERKDTYGDKDLYVSMKQSDGTWSAPVNCGPKVNSFAAEIGPFIAGDGKTVYYASEGLPGYGDADVFMIRRLDDTWTNWSDPVNLGPQINTAGWDAYFSTDAKGEWGYMVSTQNAIGSSDIFRFKLPEKAKPKIICSLKGIVMNGKTNTPMMGEIKIKVLETDSTLSDVYALPSDGSFFIAIKEGYHYALTVTYPGYIGESINVDFTGVKESVEKEVVLYLKPIEKESKIELNNIFFEENKADLHYRSKAQLDQIVVIMMNNPNMKILIGGHAMSSSADEKFNVKLSKKRAKAVYDYLVSKGIDKKRLQYVGYGSSKPVYQGQKAADNARNRCVDFTILSN